MMIHAKQKTGGPGGVVAAAVSSAGAATTPAAGRAAAPRRGRRGLIVALLVVLLGGVIAYGGGRMLTAQKPVLALAHNVAAGETITSADLVVVEMPEDPYLKPIPAADRGRVVGEVAQVPLFAGGLVTTDQVGTADGFTAGEQMVALPVKMGQMPAAGVAPGRRVLVVPTPVAGPAGRESTASGDPVAATVAAVSGKDAATGVRVVDVRVPAADGPGLARLAASGNLAVVLLPPGAGG